VAAVLARIVRIIFKLQCFEMMVSRVSEYSRHEKDRITRNNYNDVVGARRVRVAEQASGKVHSASLRALDRQCYESLEGFGCRKQANSSLFVLHSNFERKSTGLPASLVV
jgi:hypothetical protein